MQNLEFRKIISHGNGYLTRRGRTARARGNTATPHTYRINSAVIIDNRQRVLRPDGSVIAGLYAAGILCSGWFNGTYAYFGSEMSFTIYSGRSAGAEAAHYIANA